MELRPACFHKFTWSFSYIYRLYFHLYAILCLFKNMARNINLTACLVRDAAHELVFKCVSNWKFGFTLNTEHSDISLILKWSEIHKHAWIDALMICPRLGFVNIPDLHLYIFTFTKCHLNSVWVTLVESRVHLRRV